MIPVGELHSTNLRSIEDMHRRLRGKGRDPRTVPISMLELFETSTDALARYRDTGTIDRAVARIPASNRAMVLRLARRLRGKRPPPKLNRPSITASFQPARQSLASLGAAVFLPAIIRLERIRARLFRGAAAGIERPTPHRCLPLSRMFSRPPRAPCDACPSRPSLKLTNAVILHR
jgi:hypothetical protein